TVCPSSAAVLIVAATSSVVVGRLTRTAAVCWLPAQLDQSVGVIDVRIRGNLSRRVAGFNVSTPHLNRSQLWAVRCGVAFVEQCDAGGRRGGDLLSAPPRAPALTERQNRNAW